VSGRNASSRFQHAAEGAQAQWLGMMHNLAEQIQKQQQTSQQMTQELMNTYMQLLNTPGSYLSGQAEQQQAVTRSGPSTSPNTKIIKPRCAPQRRSTSRS
jgi:hypothetical protein